MEAADRLEHAVDPVADAQERLLWLEVDVRCAPLHRVDEQRAHQPHHRLRVFAFGHLQALVVDLAGLDLFEDAVHRQVEAVELVDRLLDLRLGREQRAQLDPAAQVGAQLV